MALHLKSTGIDFTDFGDAPSGTASSELLDDYEEGAFTPVMTSGGNKTGAYVQVGRAIHTIIVAGDINAGNNSSGQQITGLPFTCGTYGGGLAISYHIRVSSGSGPGILHWRVNGSSTTATGHWFNTSGVGADTIQSEWQTGGSSVYTSGIYYT